MTLSHIIDEPKNPKRKPATKEDYENALESNITSLQQEMMEINSEYNAMLRLYQKYLGDKDKFRLEYFRDGTTIVYDAHKRQKPGFRIPGAKK